MENLPTSLLFAIICQIATENAWETMNSGASNKLDRTKGESWLILYNNTRTARRSYIHRNTPSIIYTETHRFILIELYKVRLIQL